GGGDGGLVGANPGQQAYRRGAEVSAAGRPGAVAGEVDPAVVAAARSAARSRSVVAQRTGTATGAVVSTEQGPGPVTRGSTSCPGDALLERCLGRQRRRHDRQNAGGCGRLAAA